MPKKMSLLPARLVFAFIAVSLVGLLFLSGRGFISAAEDQDAPLTEAMQRMLREKIEVSSYAPQGAAACESGFAGIYPCNNVDLLSVTPHNAMGGFEGGNDIWGWTDPLDGTEYALVGQEDGTAFVDVSDPTNPLYLGRLNSHTGFSSTWRDIKVYENHAFIVSDGNPGHGMQVFDLTELRNVNNPPVTFSNTTHYNGVGSAHNVAINEDTGFAYIIGAGTCSGGLHMVDISTPTSPTFAGCFSADGYTHDVQCVTYNGPDTTYQGRELCFASNEDTLTIVDVTDKSNPVQVSRNPYAGSAYSHQGWLTEDQAYFLLGDELDEYGTGINTTTYIWDLADLENPDNFANYVAGTSSIDHNLYTHNGYAFESNYSSGLRIVDLSDIANGNLVEAAYFDTYPANNSVNFSGQWSNYPYFASGIVLANDRSNGLFILQPTLTLDYNAALGDSNATDKPGSTVSHSLTITNTGGQNDTYNLSLTAGNWSTTLVTGSPLAVTAGTSASIEVAVDIPAGATLGATDIFTLTATSTSDPLVSRSGVGTTTVSGTAGILASENMTGTAEMGEIVTYTLTFTNAGDINDTFNLEVSGNTWLTQLSASSLGPLAPGAAATVDVQVLVGYGLLDEAEIIATSHFDSTVSTSVSLETTVTTPPPDYPVYLPVMLTQP